MKSLFVDASKCIGCMSCETACSLRNEHVSGRHDSRIHVQLEIFTGDNVITYCRQCKKARCAAVCPVGAITYNAEGGYWSLDSELCEGCGKCIVACPFHALTKSPTTGRVLKCHTCQGDPTCVQACPNGALKFEDPAERRKAAAAATSS
jgi:anaerobic carbon-monoxide dehydrogenase iron sulfur subunit